MKLINKTETQRQYLTGSITLQSLAELQISNTTLVNLAKDSKFNSDCTDNLIEIDDGNTKYSTTSVFSLVSKLEKDVAIRTSPFADKILPNGKKLFTRMHGISKVVAGAPDTIDFEIPYAACKLTGIDVINGELGDKLNLKILDTSAGLISGTPNAELNQFAFNVNVASSYQTFSSKYDADLILGMKIRIEFDAITSDLLPKTIYVNYHLHEVKD